MLKEQTTKRIYGAMQKHKQFSNVPCPDGHGWKIHEEGVIDYKWTGSFIVPQKLLNIEKNFNGSNTFGTIKYVRDLRSVKLNGYAFRETTLQF